MIDVENTLTTGVPGLGAGLYAECYIAQARKRSSSAPPWRTLLSWPAPLIFGTMVASPSSPSAAPVAHYYLLAYTPDLNAS